MIGLNLLTINLLEPTLRQALNEQLFICISIKHLQDMKNRQTVSKQRVNLFAARALPRVCGAYLAQGERLFMRQHLCRSV